MSQPMISLMYAVVTDRPGDGPRFNEQRQAEAYEEAIGNSSMATRVPSKVLDPNMFARLIRSSSGALPKRLRLPRSGHTTLTTSCVIEYTREAPETDT